MRTTIVFDAGVAADLTRGRADGRVTLRGEVNRLIRLGLARERAQAAPRTSFQTPKHGLVPCGTDRDFARSEGRRWANPLVTPAGS